MCAANAGGRFVWIAPTSMIPLLRTFSESNELRVKGSAQLILSWSEKSNAFSDQCWKFCFMFTVLLNCWSFGLLMLDLLIFSSIVLLVFISVFLLLIEIILAGAFATASSNLNCFNLRTQNAFIREPKDDYILSLSLIDSSCAKLLNTENQLWYLFSVVCVFSLSMILDWKIICSDC